MIFTHQVLFYRNCRGNCERAKSAQLTRSRFL